MRYIDIGYNPILCFNTCRQLLPANKMRMGSHEIKKEWGPLTIKIMIAHLREWGHEV